MYKERFYAESASQSTRLQVEEALRSRGKNVTKPEGRDGYTSYLITTDSGEALVRLRTTPHNESLPRSYPRITYSLEAAVDARNPEALKEISDLLSTFAVSPQGKEPRNQTRKP